MHDSCKNMQEVLSKNISDTSVKWVGTNGKALDSPQI